MKTTSRMVEQAREIGRAINAAVRRFSASLRRWNESRRRVSGEDLLDAPRGSDGVETFESLEAAREALVKRTPEPASGTVTVPRDELPPGFNASRDGLVKGRPQRFDKVVVLSVSLVSAPRCLTCGTSMEPASETEYSCVRNGCFDKGVPVNTGVMPWRPRSEVPDGEG